jgi:hypothetical protein
VAFHVDYWDSLGWKDSLASKAATARQNSYGAAWGTENIYTPEFVLDGKEWRARSLGSIDAVKASGPGMLTATLGEGGKVEVVFAATTKTPGALTAHVALLGLGASSEIKSGENKGRTLVHDFSVMVLEDAVLDENGKASVRFPEEKVKPGQSALAVWITEPGKLEPVQAAGTGI